MGEGGIPGLEHRIRLRKPEGDGSDEIMLALSVKPFEGRNGNGRRRLMGQHE